MKKILLFPGWIKSLKLFEDDGSLNFRIGKLSEDDFRAEYIIGMSLGALVVLRNINRIHGKIVLINPPIPKRNILTWFVHWIRFMFAEGLLPERQRFTRNPVRFISTLIECMKLLSTDFSLVLEKFPRERILIIRGKNDRFFCDNRAAEFIKSKGIKLVEIDGGHNWSESIEKELRNL